MAEFRSSIAHRQRIFSNSFLRESAEENPIFTDIRAVLLIMKTVGLLPIWECVSRYEILPPNRFNECYSSFVRGIFYAMTLIYVYVLLVPKTAQWFYSDRDTDVGNKWIEIILCVIASSATVIFCGTKFRKFSKIINDLLKTDEEIEQKFHITLKNDCGFSNKLLIGIGAWQAYVVGSKIFIHTTYQSLPSYFIVCSYVAQNGLITIFIVFLSALLRIMAMRFAFLNFILLRYTSKPQCRATRRNHLLNAFTSMDKFPENSRFIFRTHNKLLRIYDDINECSNLILVCYMGYSFYSITENTYNLFIETTAQHNLFAVVMVWGVAWLILHISLVRLLCKNCGQATVEANTTRQILARVYVDSKEHQNIINKQLIKNLKEKVEFTAYGFFVIDFSTLFKFFTAFTTYLVILIQFKQLEDAKLQDQSALTVRN